MAGHVDEHGPRIEAVVAGGPEQAACLARGHAEELGRAIRAVG
ncbi:hypothetical protein ACWD0Z_27520 [Streptomyces sp. NPDC003007]